MTESEHITKLEALIFAQAQLIESLENKVLFLLEELRKKDIKKDSSNSSLPPSTDLFTKNKSLRKVSTRSSGGQKGHKGTTLEMSAAPDKIIELKDAFCNLCGNCLEKETFILKAKRQVIELPPIVPLYEEYQQFACQCSACKHFQVASFPAGVNAPIQYGSSIEGLVSYFSVYQYVPFARLKNLFTQLFSLPLSEGSLANILERSARKCQFVYEQIKIQIAKSTVVGSDETGAKVNGKKWWIWAWQNILNTFLVASQSRGCQTTDSIWEAGLPKSVLVSDRWAAQLKMHSGGKQICLAHLLRELTYLVEAESDLFATQFKDLLLDVFEMKKLSLLTQRPYRISCQEMLILEKRINETLLLTINAQKCPKTHTFQVSMLKCRNYLLPCLYNLEIPADNNGSERAIRNIKVKQKISGQFKSGQNTFCVIRSVIDTLIKRQVEVLPCLNQIFRLQPE